MAPTKEESESALTNYAKAKREEESHKYLQGTFESLDTQVLVTMSCFPQDYRDSSDIKKIQEIKDLNANVFVPLVFGEMEMDLLSWEVEREGKISSLTMIYEIENEKIPESSRDHLSSLLANNEDLGFVVREIPSKVDSYSLKFKNRFQYDGESLRLVFKAIVNMKSTDSGWQHMMKRAEMLQDFIKRYKK
ncbi:MAG: hypothetical protein AB9915_02160 [Candidatus Dojkabacteria bacterium]